MSASGTLDKTHWNQAGRAKQITGSQTTTLAYGSDGDLLQASGGGTTSRYFGQLFVKIGNAWRERIVANGEVVAIVNVNSVGYTTTDYMVHDNLGSPAAILDASGNLAARFAWNAWGEMVDPATGYGTDPDASTKEALTTIGYTGHEMLWAQGLVYTWARLYNPAIGRWLSPDPTVPNMYNGQSLNRYSYVLNNPLSLSDPFGLDADQWRCVLGPDGHYQCYPPLPVKGTPINGGNWFAADPNCPPGSLTAVYGIGGCQGPVGPWTDLIERSPYNPALAWWLAAHKNFNGQFDVSLQQQKQTSCSSPVSAQSLDDYLKSKGSPLAGQGNNFYSAGSQNNVDPRLIVALAGAETGFGNHITWGANNAWNWGWNTSNRSNSPFTSYATGINAVTKGIGGSYYSIGSPAFDAASAFYSKYCSGPDCVNGIDNLTSFLLQQGGNVNQLQFPCNKE